MSDQAYSAQNQKDFDGNTLAIENALLEINESKTLKATVSQLSKMTGIHRNTITNRIWPIQKLNEIKEKRKNEEKLRKQKENQKNSSVQNSSKEELDKILDEAIFWFNEYNDMEQKFESTLKRLEKMSESKDYYESLYKDTQKSLIEAKDDIQQLKELLKRMNIDSNQLRH